MLKKCSYCGDPIGGAYIVHAGALFCSMRCVEESYSKPEDDGLNITLLDHFASCALGAVACWCGKDSSDLLSPAAVAEKAYAVAEAMVKRKEQG